MFPNYDNTLSIAIPHLANPCQHLLPLMLLQLHSGLDVLQHVMVYIDTIYIYITVQW